MDLGDFSARWSGALTPPDSATYKLSIEGDGGARLWLDGNLLLDDWAQPGEQTKRTAEVKLEKERNYRSQAGVFLWRSGLLQPGEAALVPGQG